MKPFVVILVFLVLASCQYYVTDQFPLYDSVPVVNATLVAGDSVTIYLSYSNQIDTADIDYCNNALVKLYCNNELVDTLEHVGDGTYFSSYVVQENKTYSCKIAIPGYDTLSAVTSVPAKSKITDIKHFYRVGVTEDGALYPAVEVTFQNEIDNNLYYELAVKCYSESEYYTDGKRHKYGYWSDAELIFLSDSIILNEGLPIALFSNEMIIDSIYSMRLNYDTNWHSSSNNEPYYVHLEKMQIILKTVSYEYYQFTKSYYLYEQGYYGDGILTPIVNSNLYSNVKNGLGIFCGYSSTVSQIYEPNDEGREYK